ncbi:MAG: SDR family oxidoreductase [Dokdonella sp.]|uniref:SDR family NAD(P)-dependent oxidoreductase n=1 Tax=Dokdonella sp. TaxID=2291710 RepID=UPI0025BA2CC5|nr:SDR family oxidoreductase [Dokdonella sp.]MBZ0224260.1 SDR family oxidoreductase [Dokdonella sp.]
MLKNKHILVTGATSGIGYATACDLLDAGAQVIAVGRSQPRLAELSARSEGRAKTLAFDLTRFAEYRETFAGLPALDGVVCSAGIADSNPLRFFSLEKYQRLIDINQTAPIALVAELARAGKLRGGTSIVLLASILGTRMGRPGAAAYATSKAALTGFAKVAALELAGKLVRVNCLLPGMVDTELAAGQTEVSQEARQADMQRYPLGKRYAKVEEVVAAIRFLLSSESSFMTGQELVMDGGFCLP